MGEIHEEIARISSVVTKNAASSEETAGTTQQMNANAKFIWSEMRRFQLRKRVPGKAYIPPEKANDMKFIRHAQENYAKTHPPCSYIKQSQYPKRVGVIRRQRMLCLRMV